MLRQFALRTSAILMVTFLAACAANKPVSFSDMHAANRDQENAGTFTGPLYINSIKTLDDEKFEHFAKALEKSLMSHHIRVLSIKEGSYLLDVELKRHERIVDDYLEDVYEAEVTYRVTNPDNIGILYENLVLSEYSSDDSLYNAKTSKELAGKEVGNLISGAIMAGALAAVGINTYGNATPRPGTDAIRSAEEDAIGKVIRVNFEKFVDELRNTKP